MITKLLLVLFAFRASQAASLDKLNVNVLVLATYEALELPQVQGHVQRQDGKRYVLTIARVREIVEGAYAAAPLNPRFGNRVEAATRLICAAYNESGFVPSAIHHNRNKTVDIGILQVNQVHWWPDVRGRSTWKYFAQCNGINMSMSQIWDVRTNLLFGAYVNEMLLSQHKRGYQYDRRKDVRAMYDHLTASYASAMDSECRA